MRPITVWFLYSRQWSVLVIVALWMLAAYAGGCVAQSRRPVTVPQSAILEK